MRGDGTKLATTTHSAPPARLLDLTRLISRAGRVPTGVDRVELAYLRHLPSHGPLYALIRTTLGYVLLGPDGVAQIAARIEGRVPWGSADSLSRLAWRKTPAVRRAESDLRRFALDRARPNRLGAMLLRHLPNGTAYLNTGHSNLTDRTLWAVRHDLKARVAVLIHDTIPLDYPQFQRPGTVERFGALLRRVCVGADVVIYNSSATRSSAESHLQKWGEPPASVVAHLGVDRMVPNPADLPPNLPPRRPYFVTLGTIEPRKQHALLLDVWEDLARDLTPDQIPGLTICGARGWNNDEVFRRLDRLPADGPVREVAGLSDGAIAALVAGSCGLLFPSIAEGFGLPPVEAAALGVPVVCLDLAVYRETLGDIPVYLSETDRYLWRNTVESLATGRNDERAAVGKRDYVPPTWDTHFNTVLRFT